MGVPPYHAFVHTEFPSAAPACLCDSCKMETLFLLKNYFWIIRTNLKESGLQFLAHFHNWTGSGSFLLSFSVHHSVPSLCSTLLLTLSLPSSYWYSDAIVFYVLAYMFTCMCKCINMHVETNYYLQEHCPCPLRQTSH